jgi:hypothetical protein
MIVRLLFPAYLVSEANKKDHRQVAATRTRKLRADLRLFLGHEAPPAAARHGAPHQVEPRPPDGSTTTTSPERSRPYATRWRASWASNDADPRVSWRYAQGGGKRHEVGIDVSPQTWRVLDTPEATEVHVPAALAQSMVSGPQQLAPGVYDFGDLKIIVGETANDEQADEGGAT